MKKLSIVGESFYLDGDGTYTRRTGFPHADPRMAGLLINHRVINGVFDDLNESHDYDGDGRDNWAFSDTGQWDPERNTQIFIEFMEEWRAHGVIAFTVGLQGGNPFCTCPPPSGFSTKDVDTGAFNEDGSLRLDFMARLARILDRARELDMVPIVNYFYQGGIHRIREQAVGAAVENATRWLLERGYDRLIIDLANECDAGAYYPCLYPERIHELINLLRDTVDIYSADIRQTRQFYVGASFTGHYSVAESLSQLPVSFVSAVDLMLPHGNNLSSDQIRAAIIVIRQRVARVGIKPLPIVYNEDIVPRPENPSQDVGGDLGHLDVCLANHASWGNLIRSHQVVPCEDWFEGTAAQREWFARVRELAGESTAPSSVLHFYHRVQAARYRDAMLKRGQDS